jgi:endonuclease-3
VNAVTPQLFGKSPDAEAFAEMSQRELEQAIKTCGLYRTKSRNLLAAARAIVTEHGGEVPASREELERLPGVGRKTASVVLSNVFDEPAIAVDTHVFRVSRRIGLARGDTPREVEEELMAALPRESWTSAHHRLILHGRRVCQARRPRCEVCPLTRWCDWFRKNVAQREPAARPRGR